MTEDDYLLATNLAKIRIAADVMRDTLFTTKPGAALKSSNEVDRSTALQAISAIQQRLEMEISED